MIVFIAIPSAGTVKDGKLTDEFLAMFALCQRTYPKITFVAPMIQDYAVLRFMPNVSATWEEWGHHCRNLIEVSDEVWVLKYPGWETSTGVTAEITHAQEFAIPVLYINPTQPNFV